MPTFHDSKRPFALQLIVHSNPNRMPKSISPTNKMAKPHSIVPFAVAISTLPFCCWATGPVLNWMTENLNRQCNIAANQRIMLTHIRTSKRSWWNSNHHLKIRQFLISHIGSFRNHLKEILVWGNNRNYNLGLENKEGKQYPHHLDIFSKQNITIRNVSISRYHCLYVDDKGELYGVGLGDGGRLGTANENTLVLPKRIHLTNRHKNECIVGVSAATNHSIILTTEDRVRIQMRLIDFHSNRISKFFAGFYKWIECVRPNRAAKLCR